MKDFSDELIDIDLGPKELHLIEASKGKRAANYIIDVALFYGIVIGGVVLAAYLSDNIAIWLLELEDLNFFIDRLISMVLVATYFTIIEFSLKGKTIGKFVTGTRVLNYDGTKPVFATFLMRSLCRIIPFEQLSFLGENSSGWHDKWSETIVVDEKLSTF